MVPGAAAARPPSFGCLLQLDSGPAQLPAFRGEFLPRSSGSVTCGSPTLPSMWLLGRGNGGSAKPALNLPCRSRNRRARQPRQHASVCKRQINLQTRMIDIPRPAAGRQGRRDALPGVCLLYGFTGETGAQSLAAHAERLRYAGRASKGWILSRGELD